MQHISYAILDSQMYLVTCHYYYYYVCDIVMHTCNTD